MVTTALKFFFFNFTILYWFCHTSTWIRHRCTCVPHPVPPSHLPPCTIPLARLSAPAPSIQYCALDLDWLFVSYMTLYMFQCHSPKSSHPRSLPQSPKDCSIHLCLFSCLVYRVIVTIFLNSIYMICWHFKCITTGFQDYWVSFYFLVVVSFGKIIWLFSCFLMYEAAIICPLPTLWWSEE